LVAVGVDQGDGHHALATVEEGDAQLAVSRRDAEDIDVAVGVDRRVDATKAILQIDGRASAPITPGC